MAVLLAAFAVVPTLVESQQAGAAAPAGSCVIPQGIAAVGIASTSDGQGYWIATAAGQVCDYGDAADEGSMAGEHLNAPIVGIAATPDGKGYWLAAADGGVFAFGDAGFYGSMAGQHLSQPVVGMAVTADGKGYWLAAADGGVFAFGDAVFSGSDVGTIYGRVAAISAFAGEQHYLLATIDGDVTVFGFSGGSWPPGWKGSFGFPPNAPMVALANWGTATSPGYWTAGSDGGVFAFGYAPFHGSMGGRHLNASVVGMAATPDHGGYWLVGSDGGVFAFGDAPFLGSAPG